MQQLIMLSMIGLASAAQAQQAVVINPGHPLLNLSGIEERVDTARISWHAESGESTGPWQIQHQSKVEFQGEAAIRLISTVGRPGGDPMLVDTSYFRQADLAPLHHHSVGPGRDLVLDYRGSRVIGELREADAAPRPVDLELEAPVFDPSAIEIVLRSIEWDAGLAVEIPTFDHASLAPGSVTARPVGSEFIHSGEEMVPAWMLALDYGTHRGRMWLARDGSSYVLVPAVGDRGDLHMSYGPVTVPSLEEAAMALVIDPRSGIANGNLLHASEVDRRVEVQRPTGDPVIIEIRDRLERGSYRGADAWIRIQHITTPAGERVDSALFEIGTMAPLYHSGHAGNHSMTLDFDGAAVTGGYVPQDSAGARTIDQTLPHGVFDSNAMDLVVASLPLEPGFAARVPLYWYERGGLTWLGVTVEGIEQFTTVRGSEPAWRTELVLMNRPRTVWISTSDRMVLGASTTLGDGREITNTLVRVDRVSSPEAGK